MPAEIDGSTSIRANRVMEVLLASGTKFSFSHVVNLHDAVSTLLMEDPKSGSIYAFINKRRTLLKILYWDDSGIRVLTKRLEKGIVVLKQTIDALNRRIFGKSNTNIGKHLTDRSTRPPFITFNPAVEKPKPATSGRLIYQADPSSTVGMTDATREE